MNVDEEFRAILSGVWNQTADMRALNARIEERRKIAEILMAWDRAVLDPNFKAPSYLLAVIESARE